MNRQTTILSNNMLTSLALAGVIVVVVVVRILWSEAPV